MRVVKHSSPHFSVSNVLIEITAERIERSAKLKTISIARNSIRERERPEIDRPLLSVRGNSSSACDGGSVRLERARDRSATLVTDPGKFRNGANLFADLDFVVLPFYSRGFYLYGNMCVYENMGFQLSYSSPSFPQSCPSFIDSGCTVCSERCDCTRRIKNRTTEISRLCVTVSP